jgi:hypothetical protein
MLAIRSTPLPDVDPASMQLELSKKVKEGCKEEGLIGLTFNTIGIRYDTTSCLPTTVQ